MGKIEEVTMDDDIGLQCDVCDDWVERAIKFSTTTHTYLAWVCEDCLAEALRKMRGEPEPEPDKFTGKRRDHFWRGLRDAPMDDLADDRVTYIDPIVVASWRHLKELTERVADGSMSYDAALASHYAADGQTYIGWQGED